MTATARGASSGRSDAAVASRFRASSRARAVADGLIESVTSTQPPASDLDRISNPESRKTSSICVLSSSVVASKR